MLGSVQNLLVGLIIGVLYIYLKDLLPLSKGINPLRTPIWFKRIIDNLNGLQTYVRNEPERGQPERFRLF